jgi:hypothetical protein
MKIISLFKFHHYFRKRHMKDSFWIFFFFERDQQNHFNNSFGISDAEHIIDFPAHRLRVSINRMFENIESGVKRSCAVDSPSRSSENISAVEIVRMINLEIAHPGDVGKT